MKKLTLGYLYPEYMNIYGDTGNIIALINRGKSREIEIEVQSISKNSELKNNTIDIYFFGGGQDQQQVFVSQDIQRLAPIITDDINRGAVALTICGGYQLFGKFYRPFEGDDLKGIDIFPSETHASNTRMINNLVVKTNQKLDEAIQNIYTTQWEIPHTLVGFENHSGQTTLTPATQTLGQTLYGYGNNESKQYEGCWVKNAFGTYMHGSLLPKNPHFTDYLLHQATKYRYQDDTKFEPLPDTLALQAHNHIVKKYA